MISIWWLLVAFIGGGWAGMLLMILLRMSAKLAKHSTCALDFDGSPLQTIQVWVEGGGFSHVQAPRSV